MSMPTQHNAPGASTIVELPAVISIAEVGKLRDGLLGVLESECDVQIDASAVQSIDGAGLQLLAAFVESIHARNRTFRWQGVTTAVTAAAERLGLRDLLRLAEAGVTADYLH